MPASTTRGYTPPISPGANKASTAFELPSGTTVSHRGKSTATTTTTASKTGSRYSSVPHPKDLPSAGDLRKAIPAHCFNKSLPTSMAYLARDLALVFGTMWAFHGLVQGEAWGGLSLAAKMAITVAYWLADGLFMWCLFVVGHDCGHGTFSEHQWFNDIIGHVAHASILVPYWPWQRSHHMHHSYHNNGGPKPCKDKSHPWTHTDERELMDSPVWAFMRPLRGLMPIIGWPMYVIFAEGGHFTPFGGELWEGADTKTRVKALVSGAAVIGVAAAIGHTLAWDLADTMMVYGGPYFVFSWWLFTVTFLQHHHPESVVYEDGAWSYIKGAFETVDRTYGMGIDNFHHNISNGHVAHHIFFTKIPHYHLLEATEAIKGELKTRGAEHWYLHRDNTLTGGRWFVTEVWRQLHNHYFAAATWVSASGKLD